MRKSTALHRRATSFNGKKCLFSIVVQAILEQVKVWIILDILEDHQLKWKEDSYFIYWKLLAKIVVTAYLERWNSSDFYTLQNFVVLYYQRRLGQSLRGPGFFVNWKPGFEPYLHLTGFVILLRLLNLSETTFPQVWRNNNYKVVSRLHKIII